ncbi:MAG: ATP-binding protein, partial [Lachnospiraceae bacterium]|nr:ATP-binding protein [Lachnospiraceae bacterium]
MTRYFNTEGRCRPDQHYMVRLDERLKVMKEQFVDRGKYFVINRGRQYGKTTTLRALADYLRDDYAVISMDFQKMSTASFADEPAFVKAFIEYMEDIFWGNERLKDSVAAEAYQRLIDLATQKERSMDGMFRCLSRICRMAARPVVLMIDEVDNASNNQVFVDFLAQLRGYWLSRGDSPIFHSVSLA